MGIERASGMNRGSSDRGDVFWLGTLGDLRRKVLELAAIVREPGLGKECILAGCGTVPAILAAAVWSGVYAAVRSF
jgi:hypothetical protein